MGELSKSAKAIEKRKESNQELSRKILRNYIRAIIQSIPSIGGAIEKALFANLDAVKEQEIEDLITSLSEKFNDSQNTITKNTNDIESINNILQQKKQNFDYFLTKLSAIEILDTEIREELKGIIGSFTIAFSEIQDRIKVLEEESLVSSYMFVTSDVYFKSNGTHLLDTPITNFERFCKYIDFYKQFIESNNCVLIISGKGGNGKTHLLKEIGIVESNNFVVLFTNSGLRSIEKAIQDELKDGNNYILVLDDADRNQKELSILIAYTKAYSQKCKIILTSRPAGLDSINKCLYDANLVGNQTKIEVEDWNDEELVRLLKLIGIKKDEQELLLIAKTYPIPFLITWIGRKLQNKSTFTIDNIIDIFVSEIYKAANDISHFIPRPIELLLDLTLIIPFYTENTKLKTILSKRYNVEIQAIEQSFAQLINNSILRQTGNTIRFNPDMKGDLFLYYYFEKNKFEKQQKELFNFWFNIEPEKVLININALSRYSNSSQITSFSSEIINNWISSAATTDGYYRKNNLKLLSYISHLAPNDTLNLMATYLEVKQPMTHLDNQYIFEPTSDDFGPVIISLGWIEQIRSELLDLIFKLSTIKTGSYDNYKLENIVVSLVSPVKNNLNLILKTLEIIEEWVNEHHPIKLTILESAIKELLSGTHRITEQYIFAIQIKEKVLIANPEIINMREKAFQLLIDLFHSNYLDAKIASFGVARTLGQSSIGISDISQISLRDRIKEEYSRLVELFGSTINNETSLIILYKIEELFLYWFASETAGTASVVDYLNSFPKSIEYKVFRFFVDPDNVIMDFNETMKNAPQTGKWSWMFENCFSKYDYISDPVFFDLAKELNQKYYTPEMIIGFLNDLEILIDRKDVWNHPRIISEWVKINYCNFETIRKTDELWKKLPKRFKQEIEIEFAKHYSDHTQMIATRLLSDLSQIDLDELANFLVLLCQNRIDVKNLKEWLDTLISTQNLQFLEVISKKLYFIFKLNNEPKTMCDMVTNILEPFDENKINLIYLLHLSFGLLMDNRIALASSQSNLLITICKKYLNVLPRLTYEIESVLNFCYYDMITDFIDLLTHRLTHRASNNKQFEAIPHLGFTNLNKIINTLDNFVIFYDKIQMLKKNINNLDILINGLENNIINLVNNLTGKQFVLEYIDNLIRENDFRSAIELLPYLDDYNKHTTNILKVTDLVLAEGYQQDVVRIYSAFFKIKSIVYDASELKKRKTFFEKILTLTKPGLHNKIIKDQIFNIDIELERMSQSDLEYYIPRG